MWEAWEDSSCNTAWSHDHAFMGTVDDWLFSNIAGIQSTASGFRTVAIDPTPVEGLTHASAYETSPLGRVTLDSRKVKEDRRDSIEPRENPGQQPVHAADRHRDQHRDTPCLDRRGGCRQRAGVQGCHEGGHEPGSGRGRGGLDDAGQAGELSNSRDDDESCGALRDSNERRDQSGRHGGAMRGDMRVLKRQCHGGS
jgi:hypothetical protein